MVEIKLTVVKVGFSSKVAIIFEGRTEWKGGGGLKKSKKLTDFKKISRNF